MAIVKPFRGVRPPKELVEQVASRPYDVLNSEEARAEAGDNQKSLYHIIKPEIDFPAGTDEHDEKVYAKALENFNKFQKEGWLVQDDKDRYYVYAQTMQAVVPNTKGAFDDTFWGALFNGFAIGTLSEYKTQCA